MMSKSKILLLLIISLAVVAIVAAVFWFRNYSQQDRELSTFVPASALSYLEIDLASDRLNQYLENNLKAKNLLEEFLVRNDLAANIWRGEVEIDRIGLVTLIGEDNSMIKAWLIHGRDDVIKLEGVGLEGYYYAILNDKTAVLSHSREAMNNVRSSRRINSLTQDKMFDGLGVIYGYMKNDLWQTKMEDFFRDQNLVNQYFVLDDQEVISWQIEIEDQNVVFDINILIEDSQIDISKSKEESLGFLDLDNVVMIRDFDFDAIVGILGDKISQQEDIDWEIFREYVDNKYDIKIEKLYTFFKQSILLVLDPKKRVGNLGEWLESDNYYYALVWQNDDRFGDKEILLNLERLAQNYLAFKFPETKTKVLPDQTTGQELVANADKFIWQEERLDQGIIRFINHKDWQLAYGLNDQKFVLSNSKILVRDVLASQEMGVEDGGDYNIRLDSQVMSNKYLELGETLWLRGGLSRGELTIHGSLESN